MSSNKKTPKFYESRESLPEDLRPFYDDLVAWYVFYSVKHYGREYVSYKIIADLVREGWRPTDPGKPKQ